MIIEKIVERGWIEEKNTKDFGKYWWAFVVLCFFGALSNANTLNAELMSRLPPPATVIDALMAPRETLGVCFIFGLLLAYLHGYLVCLTFTVIQNKKNPDRKWLRAIPFWILSGVVISLATFIPKVILIELFYRLMGAT